MRDDPNLLFYDLETSPNKAFVWKWWETNIIELIEEGKIICVGYQWGIDGKVRVHSLRTFNGNHKKLIKKLWGLLDKADVKIHQNGDAFDEKVANTAFLGYKLPPPSPSKNIDTLKLRRKYFKELKNDLDYIQTKYKGKGKIKVDKSIWTKCVESWYYDKKYKAKNTKYWLLMERYCKNDVSPLLVDNYKQIQGWHKNTPIIRHGIVCQACGSKEVKKNGTERTRNYNVQLYKCKECGLNMRSNMKEKVDKGEYLK